MASARVIYAGTPEFAVSGLQALRQSDVEIVAVYTQPDRPSGRGRKLTSGPVKQWALGQGLAVFQPVSLKEPYVQQQLKDLQADLMVVAAYGQILPAAVLQLPRLGCINIHASLLPRWRGAAPIQRAILAGDRETGITLMQMDEGLDTGAMLAKRSLPISPEHTAADLHDELAVLGGELLLESLPRILQGELPVQAQDAALASYAEKISKSEAWLDWSKAGTSLIAQVNAFNPWPVAQTRWHEHVLRIWQLAKVDDLSAFGKKITDIQPGEVLHADENGICVGCGDGALKILQLQKPGSRKMSAGDFIHAQDLSGQQFT